MSMLDGIKPQDVSNISSPTDTQPTQISSAGSKPAVVDMKDTKALKNLADTLGVTVKFLKDAIETNPQLLYDIEALKSYVNGTSSGEQTTSSPQAAAKPNDGTFTNSTGKNFDFNAFNQASSEDKIKTVLEEFVKNRYGEQWDTFTPEQKAQYAQETRDYLLQQYNKTGQDTDINAIANYLNNKSHNLTDIETKKLNSFMLDLQTANSKNMSYEDYLQQKKDVRNSQKYSLIDSLSPEKRSALSESDRTFYETEKIYVNAGRAMFGDDITSENLSKKIAAYNEQHPDEKISRASLAYIYLKDNKGNLDTNETQLFGYLTNLQQAGVPLSEVPDFDSSNTTFINMRTDEAYQQALAGGKTDKEAQLAYIKSRLTNEDGTALSEDEFRNRLRDLYSGCSLSGAGELTGLLKEAGIVNKNGRLQNIWCDDRAFTAAIAGDHSIDANAACDAFDRGDVQNGQLWVDACYRHTINKKETDNIKIYNRRETPTINDETNKKMTAAGWSEDDKFEVADDVNVNRSLYTQAAASNVIKNGARILNAESETKFSHNVQEMIQSTRNEEDYAAYASSASSYETENQTAVAQSVMSMADYFSDEANIRAQNALADDIHNCDKNNQLNIHNMVMTSKYSQVQEHAAGNIKNYDPSVQSDAMDTVYASGNKKAIDAAVNSISEFKSPEVMEKEMQRALGEAILSDTQTNTTEKFLSGNLTYDEVSRLSAAERREYIENYFNKLPITEKIKFITKYAKGSLGKTIYTTLVRTNSPLFDEICKDKDNADNLLSMGLPEEVTNKVKNVVRFLSVSNLGFRKLAEKYEIEYDGQTSKSDIGKYDTTPKTANTLKGERYIISPFSNDIKGFDPLEFLRRGDTYVYG